MKQIVFLTQNMLCSESVLSFFYNVQVNVNGIYIAHYKWIGLYSMLSVQK
jgi:hypothetical protein